MQRTCKSKGRGNTETRICYRSSFSFEKYVSVWRGCGTQCSHEGQQGPPYSPHALTNARCRDPLRGGLEGGNRTFTIQGWGNLHNLIGGSQQPWSFTTMEWGSEVTSSSRAPMHPRVTRSTRESGG